MHSKLLGAALFAATVFASPSSAVTVVGSAAVAIVGVSADMDSIGVGTTFTNTNISTVGTAFGDFAPTVGENLTLSSLTASIGSAFNFTSSFGDFAGMVENTESFGTSNDRTVRAFVLGLFTPLGTLSAFAPGPASATFSFTQTGGDSAVSGSFSLASPPETTFGAAVPEPQAWTMLIVGFGLVGFAARRRKNGAVAS